MLFLLLFSVFDSCLNLEFYKTTALKNGRRMLFVTMAESDSLAGELAAYKLFQRVYFCNRCTTDQIERSRFLFTLMDRCPFPGTIDDAFWSVSQRSDFKTLRQIDDDLVEELSFLFPGFKRDFIREEDPAVLRDYFAKMMSAPRPNIEKDPRIFDPDTEGSIWDFFMNSEVRVGKYRPILNVRLNFTGPNEHFDFDRIKSKVVELTNRKKRSDTLKVEPLDQDHPDKGFLEDRLYPLHRENNGEQNLNNIFVELIERIKDGTLDWWMPVPKEPERPPAAPKSPFQLESWMLPPVIAESLQRQAMSDPKWRRSQNSTYFQMDKDLMDFLGYESEDDEEFWLIQDDKESSLFVFPETLASNCDRNHFQFRLTSHRSPGNADSKIVRNILDASEEFILMRNVALLWPTAIQFVFFPGKCYFVCPGFGKAFFSAGCLEDQICDFESANSCDWRFTTSDDEYEIEKHEFVEAKKRGPLNATFGFYDSNFGRNFQPKRSPEQFQVVVGMVSERNTTSNHYAYFSSKKKSTNAALIVSPFYQHSSSNCLLTFKYRVIGEPGAHLLVTTQLIPLFAISTEEVSDAEAEDWTIPTQRYMIQASNTMSESVIAQVPIGEVSYPTRIRIECHPNGDPGPGQKSEMNVECFVDDIRLENCEEHIWQPNICSMDKEPKRYLCHLYKEQKCIDYSDICDLQGDCPNREDEDNKIHNCKLAPPSARCTFEETRYEAGCENWQIVNMPNSMELIRLASVADSMPVKSGKNSNVRQTKMPLDKTNNIPGIGHYLMFSTFGDDHAVSSQFSDTGLLYSHAMTPIYPRMDPKLKDPGNKLFGTCMVRFFFCHVGSTNFQIILERIKNPYKKVIWTPPRASLIEPCVWEKATIVLDYQPSEYFLKFGIAKMNNHKAMFLMDDFSLSPNCFLMKAALLESTLPPLITLTSCGLSGPTPPTAKQCENPVNDYKTDGQLAISGRRSFMVDKKAEYRIEIYGAAGGSIPNQPINNFGGLVIINAMLDMADEITFVVGQQGESPCYNKFKSKKQQQIADLVCSNSTKQRSKLQNEEIMNVVGSAGGGASAIFVNGKPIAIAGGGGGLFPTEILVPTDGRNSSEGGKSVQHVTYSEKYSPIRQELQWGSGHGGSFNSPDLKAPPPDDCSDCQVMSGQLLSPSNAKPGICPTNRNWSLAGGFGGGGAACGPGAGGGSGYVGGRAGFKFHGEGGGSVVFLPIQQFIGKAGVNEGNGKIVIRACTLPCVVNATCRFEFPVDGKLPKEFCECPNGVVVTGAQTCDDYTKGFAGTVKDTFGITHPRTLLTLILLILLLLLTPCLIYILYRIYSNRRKQKAFKNFHDELQMIATDPLGIGGAGAIVTRGSISSSGQVNLITGNPIYQYVEMMDIPRVNREWCELNDIIGHGAFGEVRSGTLKRPGEAPFRVAIKTLPFESNPEVFSDFQTEAKILSNFSHPNIVKFFGLCFDSIPKFIVLELLEGGDLKNYLRECRPRHTGIHYETSSVPVSPVASPMVEPVYQLMMVDLILMCLDVAHGCEYLENNKFVHRDIAARNCLLTSKNPLFRTVKIADFGMARDIYKNDYYRKGGRAFLPVKWMPPEAFLDGIFTSKTDTWAFGVLLWEVFSLGYTPYPGRQNQEVMQLIVAGGRLDPPIGTPDEIYQLMIRCWETNAEDRPNFKQIIRFLAESLNLPSVVNAPLPPIVYKMSHQTMSETPPMATRSSAPPGDSDPINPMSATSQATLSTLLQSSMTESTTTSSYDSMPTKGEGVTHNLCTPYEAKHPRSAMESRPLERIASGDDSISSHDESTLHDTCSVKQSPYKIEKTTSGLLPQPGSSTGSGLSFHKRLFRKSSDKPKTGVTQPLIQSTSSSSSTTNGQSPKDRTRDDDSQSRGSAKSPPLPSQLI